MKKEKRKFQYKREYTPVIIAVIVLFALVAGLYFVLGYNEEIVSDINENEIENKFEEVEVSVPSGNNDLKKAANAVSVEYGFVDLIEAERPADYNPGMIIERKYNADNLADIMDEMQSTDDEKYIIDKFLYVRLTGMSSDIYAKIDTELLDLNKVINYEEGKKKYNFLTKNIYVSDTYTIDIYSKNDVLLRKITFTPPKVNIYYNTYLCSGKNDLKVCQLFLEDTYSYDEMVELTGYDESVDIQTRIDEFYKNKKREKEIKSNNPVYNKVDDILKNKYIFYYIIGVIVVSIAGIFIVVRGKKHEKK